MSFSVSAGMQLFQKYKMHLLAIAVTILIFIIYRKFQSNKHNYRQLEPMSNDNNNEVKDKGNRVNNSNNTTEFIESTEFTGEKKGYVFTTKNGKTGYYRDANAQ